jgi:BolA protein
MNDRVSLIRARLEAAFAPAAVEVRDDSALHAGHAGAAGGAGHYHVRIEAPRFAGLPLLARHRLVHEALAALLVQDIHALSIDARGPGERPVAGRADAPR